MASSLLALVNPTMVRWTQPTGAAPKTVNRALLVGVSHYPHLASRWQLEGPPNDVARFKELLLGGRFAPFKEADISVLAGWPATSASRPTRANIEREFHHLAEVAGRGDQIVILMAGHGSQQPAAPHATDEPDGLDELFLPADVEGWDGQTQRVRNAIVDDEIAVWLATIRAKGAFVWIVFDSCHSGTMTRGEERQRGIPASELVPADVLASLPGRLRSTPYAVSPLDDLTKSDSGIVAMYAVQSFQSTPELRLPANGEWHGLFTYTLLEVLSQTRDPLSYRELIDRIRERYRSLPRFNETPALEGSAINRAVLGREQLPDQPPFRLGSAAPDRSRTLEAGHLHGLTKDAVLAVYPAAGSAHSNELVGYVRVTSVEATRSHVVPIAFDGHPAPSDMTLTAGARCRFARRAVGEAALRVGTASKSPRLLNAVRDLDRLSQGLASGQTDVADATWILIEDVTTHQVLLEHRSNAIDRTREADGIPFSDVSAGGARVLVASGGSDADVAAQLANAASRIARVEALRALAVPEPGSNAPRLEVSARVYDQGGGSSGRLLDPGSAGRILHPGEQVEFRIRNKGKRSADVTVLFLDGAYGISALYPRREGQLDTLIAPGREVLIGRYPVTADTLGEEDLIVFGLLPSTPPINLTVLEQPAVTMRSRGTTPPVRLSTLLASALKGTRGLADNVLVRDDDYAVSLFSWRTVAAHP